MGKWRQAVELAMTDEEMEALTAISRSRSIEQIFCPSPIVDTDFISDWWTAAQILIVSLSAAIWQVDLGLRCMEDELAPQAGKAALEFQYQKLFSELWVGGVYETLRLLTERKLALLKRRSNQC